MSKSFNEVSKSLIKNVNTSNSTQPTHLTNTNAMQSILIEEKMMTKLLMQ